MVFNDLESNEIPIVLNSPSLRWYRHHLDKNTNVCGTRPHLVRFIEGTMARLQARLPKRWSVGLFHATSDRVNQDSESDYQGNSSRKLSDKATFSLVEETRLDLMLGLCPFDEAQQEMKAHKDWEFKRQEEKIDQANAARRAFYDAGYEIKIYDGRSTIVKDQHSRSARIVATYMGGRWVWHD